MNTIEKAAVIQTGPSGTTAGSSRYLMDFSLGLINRTGAYVICRDLLQELPHYFPQVRYWRMLLGKTPDGLPRRIAGRLMMMEITKLRGRKGAYWPEGKAFPGKRRLILDPLYVLRSRLDRDDIVQCHDIGPVSHPELFGPSVSGLYAEAYDKIKQVGPGMVFVSDLRSARSVTAMATIFGSCKRSPNTCVPGW